MSDYNIGDVAPGDNVKCEFGPFYDFTGVPSVTFNIALAISVYVRGSGSILVGPWQVGSGITVVGNFAFYVSFTAPATPDQYTVRIGTGTLTNGADLRGRGKDFTVVASGGGGGSTVNITTTESVLGSP